MKKFPRNPYNQPLPSAHKEPCVSPVELLHTYTFWEPSDDQVNCTSTLHCRDMSAGSVVLGTIFLAHPRNLSKNTLSLEILQQVPRHFFQINSFLTLLPDSNLLGSSSLLPSVLILLSLAHNCCLIASSE